MESSLYYPKFVLQVIPVTIYDVARQVPVSIVIVPVVSSIMVVMSSFRRVASRHPNSTELLRTYPAQLRISRPKL